MSWNEQSITASSNAAITAPLGENVEAASVSVTLATDEEAVAVSATQLPAAIGEQTSAASLSITFASDEEPLPISPFVPAAANILAGYQSFTATTAATTVITIPANRVWQGEVDISAAVQEAGAGAVAGVADAVISLSGVGSTPAPGSLFAVRARSGANVVAGTVGSQGDNSGKLQVVIAAGANPVLVQATITVAGTGGVLDVTAAGVLIA